MWHHSLKCVSAGRKRSSSSKRKRFRNHKGTLWILIPLCFQHFGSGMSRSRNVCFGLCAILSHPPDNNECESWWPWTQQLREFCSCFCLPKPGRADGFSYVSLCYKVCIESGVLKGYTDCVQIHPLLSSFLCLPLSLSLSSSLSLSPLSLILSLSDTPCRRTPFKFVRLECWTVCKSNKP